MKNVEWSSLLEESQNGSLKKKLSRETFFFWHIVLGFDMNVQLQ